jgi:hypothetical protein
LTARKPSLQKCKFLQEKIYVVGKGAALRERKGAGRGKTEGKREKEKAAGRPAFAGRPAAWFIYVLSFDVGQQQPPLRPEP